MGNNPFGGLSSWTAGDPSDLQFRRRQGQPEFLRGPEGAFVGGGSTAWYPQFTQVAEGQGLGSLKLSMPAGFRAIATAKKTSDVARGERRVAEFKAGWPTQFGFTAGPYTVVKSHGSRPIAVYLLKNRPYAADLSKLAWQSIAILEKEFGPYPFEDFAIVEVPSAPAQQSGFLGAAYDGYMLMRSDYLDQKRADPLFFGHEIGHQWWGVSVSKSAGKGEYLVDEALAQYGALRVVEEVSGQEAARKFRAGEGDFPGVQDAMMLIAAGNDEPLADLPRGSGFYELSDTKGYLVYDLFNRVIGAERMRGFFREITASRAHSSISWEDYLSRLKAHAGPDHHWLLDQWLNRKGLPVLSLTWAAEAGVAKVEIQQLQTEGPPYRLQIPVRLTFADGSAQTTMVEAAQERSAARLAAAKPLRHVELDPDRTVPWVSPAEFARAVALAQATRARLLWDHGKAEEAGKLLKIALDARTSPEASAAEFLERFYYGWIIEEAGQLAEALDQYQRALSLPVRDEAKLGQLYLNIARVALAKGDKPLSMWAARAAIAQEAAWKGEAAGIKERAQKYLPKGARTLAHIALIVRDYDEVIACFTASSASPTWPMNDGAALSTGQRDGGSIISPSRTNAGARRAARCRRERRHPPPRPQSLGE
jgi:aminopeptidase N